MFSAAFVLLGRGCPKDVPPAGGSPAAAAGSGSAVLLSVPDVCEGCQSDRTPFSSAVCEPASVWNSFRVLLLPSNWFANKIKAVLVLFQPLHTGALGTGLWGRSPGLLQLPYFIDSIFKRIKESKVCIF